MFNKTNQNKRYVKVEKFPKFYKQAPLTNGLMQYVHKYEFFAFKESTHPIKSNEGSFLWEYGEDGSMFLVFIELSSPRVPIQNE